jgi:protein-S-isoprenylcysteine O-methyltransferase Ste14
MSVRQDRPAGPATRRDHGYAPVMRKGPAAIVTSTFFAVGPCVVAGVIPWRLTHWKVRRPVPGGVPVRVAGALLLCGGALEVAHAFVRFVVEGLGTPVPVAPPTELVVGGPYRHVRNPMYVAIGGAILGQAMLLGQPVLVLYAAGLAVPAVTFVRLYEEPTLRRTFGEQYEEYRRNVRGWWPRLTPWRPGRNAVIADRGKRLPCWAPTP